MYKKIFPKKYQNSFLRRIWKKLGDPSGFLFFFYFLSDKEWILPVACNICSKQNK